MSYCQRCQEFGAWIVSARLKAIIEFYEDDPEIEGWSTDPAFKLPHHKSDSELYDAAENGCQLCKMILQLDPKAKERTNESSESTGRFFEIDFLNTEQVSYRALIPHENYPPVCLTVYSTQKSPLLLQDHLHQDIHRNALADGVRSTVDRWIAQCLQEHKGCNKTSTVDYAPTRLLDVGPPDGSREPRLVETRDLQQAEGVMGIFSRLSVNSNSPERADLHGTQNHFLGNAGLEYTTLSHCWGKTVPFTTTQDTLRERIQGVPMSVLPKTFAHAVLVTRSLQIRYLWIDSLCIIQDSVVDWQRESGRMGSYYSSAVVNIAAAAAENADAGFLFDRMAPIKLPDMLAQPAQKREMWIRPFAKKGDGYLSDRAWCYQESILPRRTLIFGRHELSFRCRECLRFETRPMADISLSSSSKFLNLDRGNDDENLKIWRMIVEEYAGRKLTFAKDKLPALSGLASHFGNIQEDKYLAGIWARDLPSALCWYSLGDEPETPTRYIAPSWSWASQPRSVSHFSRIGRHIGSCKVSVLDWDIQQSSSDPFGQVESGWLKLHGRLLPVELLSHNEAIVSGKKGSVEVYPDRKPESSDPQLVGMLLYHERDSWYGESYQEAEVLLLKAVENSDSFERFGLLNIPRDSTFWIKNTGKDGIWSSASATLEEIRII